MNTPEAQYDALRPSLKRLEEEALFILRDQLQAKRIKTHSLLSRIKTLESVQEKALRKNLQDPLKELQDLVGARVVCLLRSDIGRIGELIHKQFVVITEDNKLDGEAVESFGYQSVHFIVNLPPQFTGPRYAGLHDIKFEIQVRTLAMDAWAALSHYLDYKSEPDVPKHLRKDFFALSGLFYVADTHFELFYADRQKSRSAANREAEAQSTEGVELNFDTLNAYLRKHYPQREGTGARGISELVRELTKAGYSTIDKLDAALKASQDAFLLYEKAHPPSMKKGKTFISGGKFADVGVVRVSLAIVDKAYAEEKFSAHDPVNDFRKHVKR